MAQQQVETLETELNAEYSRVHEKWCADCDGNWDDDCKTCPIQQLLWEIERAVETMEVL